MILGDSYSAFRGYIPENYQTYYSMDERPDADVRRVEEMWWYQLFQETDSNLVFNDSWAATTICNTGYDGPNAPDSFIRRFERLVKQGFFEKIILTRFLYWEVKMTIGAMLLLAN